MSSRLIRGGEAAAAEMWKPQRVGRSTETGRSEPLSADLQRELDARVKAAYAQGQAAGEAAAMQRVAEQAAQKLEPVLKSLQQVIHEFAGMRKRFRGEAEADTVKLAIAIARRVLYRELATDPEAILGLVMAAFQKLNARETHRLRVSAGDAEAIEKHRARLELPPAVEILGDGSLAAGSAIFETERGELDASVNTQLAEIERGLTDIVRKRVK
jgi:flagellar assembly protein FliH